MNAHFEHHTYSGFEPLQAFDVVYGGHFEHRLISPERATMVHQRLIIGDVRIETGSYDFPVVAQGAMPRGAVCIGLVAEGVGLTRYNTQPASNDAIQVYAPDAELMYHTTGASRWINFTAANDMLQHLSLAHHGRMLALPERGIMTARLPAERRACLQVLADDAFALAQAMQPVGIGRELAGEMSRALALAYVDALQDADTRKRDRSATASRHYKLILACERIALEAGMFELDMHDLARRTGFSRRSLERIFHDRVGTTPGRWFRNIRLNGALRDLVAPVSGRSVTDVAVRWGFRHLSRFSEQYRKTFGELPSQTLNRAQSS